MAIVLPLADLLGGSTVLLGLGAVVAVLARAPVHWQRSAELSVAATLVWLILALAPFPRWESGAAALQRLAIVDRWDTSSAVRSGGVTASHGDVASPRPTPDAAEGGPTLATPAASSSDAEATNGSRLRQQSLAGDRVRYLAVILATGSVLVAAYVLFGVVLVRRLLRRSIPPPSWLGILFDARCRKLGVRRARLRLTQASRRPLTAGIVSSTVLLPMAIAVRGRERDLSCVIDHELVHVRRRDVLSRSLFAAAAVVLWPHPLFWWLRARAALAAELLADDGAAHGSDRRTYASSVLTLSEEFQSLRPVPGVVPGALGNRSELTRRIEMLVSKHDRLATTLSPGRRAIQAAVTVLTVSVCAALFGVGALPAEESAIPSEGKVLQQEVSDPGSAGALTLVDRALTLRSELELAQVEFVDADRRHTIGDVDEIELRRAQFNIIALQRRLDAVLIIVESEVQATQIELMQIQEAAGLGTASPGVRVQMVRLSGRLKVLQSVLGT
ncbi:MAG: M56 family metallopeptidase [Longimicrobiales bacterium]